MTKTNIIVLIFIIATGLIFVGLFAKDQLLQNRPKELKQVSQEVQKDLPGIVVPTIEPTVSKDYTGGIMDLKIETIKQGTGDEIKVGQTAEVHYVGTLLDGTKFDSSRDRNKTFEFKLGENSVIAGWEKGVLGMKKGEVRKLTIPSDLGYGDRGAGGVIPPKATLLFEVELVSIK